MKTSVTKAAVIVGLAIGMTLVASAPASAGPKAKNAPAPVTTESASWDADGWSAGRWAAGRWAAGRWAGNGWS